MLQNANISDEHVFCSAPATRHASLKILFKCPTPAIAFGNATKPSRFCSLLTRCTIPCACHAEAHLNVQKCSVPVTFLHFWLQNVLRVTMACTFSTSQLPKVVQSWCVLCILTSKCASRPNGMHLFNISTSKSGPNLVYVLFILTCKCASRHNGVQFFISHLARWLRTRRFSEPYFSTLRSHKPLEKTQCFATFLPFRAFASSFFWLFLFSDLLSSTLLFSLPPHISAFHLSILSEVWLLNFLRSFPIDHYYWYWLIYSSIINNVWTY